MKFDGIPEGFLERNRIDDEFDDTVTKNIPIKDRVRIAKWMGLKTVEETDDYVSYRNIGFNSLDDCDHISRHVMTLPRVVQNQYLMQLLFETMGNRVKEEKLDATKHHLSACVAWARPIDRVRAALTIIGMMDKGWPNDEQVK